MKLSTRSRYGARAMLDLALNYGNGPVILKEIARRQGVSERYLENIMVVFVSGGLVNSARGKQGGFTLARAPADIRLSEIIRLTEGALAPVHCVDDPGACKRASTCVTMEIWGKLRDSINSVLGSITLAGMVERHKELAVQLDVQMYYI